MINNDKWINSLHNVKVKVDEESFQIDHDKWVNTIPRKNKFNSVKKYTFMTIIFVSSLLFVLAVKNETRLLQKTINNLEEQLYILKRNFNIT